MLVLSRSPLESVLIGDSVKVTVVRIGPNSVRLGIEAPRDMNIVRSELLDSPCDGVTVPGGLAIDTTTQEKGE